MTEDSSDSSHDWEKVWDARLAALAQLLGASTKNVWHATTPFFLGGAADVVHLEGASGHFYVTAELSGNDVGQIPCSLWRYELMICTKEPSHQAPRLISQLASYTCEAVLEPGDTMDIPSYFKDSSIRGLYFTLLGNGKTHFELLGEKYGLLLCIGITDDELEYKLEHGSEMFLNLLKEHGVFPYTNLQRASVL
jgi:hypothetical protein